MSEAETAAKLETLLARAAGKIGMRRKLTPVGAMLTHTCLICTGTTTFVMGDPAEYTDGDEARTRLLFAWIESFTRDHEHAEGVN